MKTALFARAAIVCAAALLRAIAPAPASAANDMVLTQCPDFSGPAWTNPYPPNDTHTQYRLGLNQHEMTCAQAETWAKKFIGMHIAPAAGIAAPKPLTGGPPGYKCTAAPDNAGRAYQGSCIKIGTDPFAAAFNWGGSEK